MNAEYMPLLYHVLGAMDAAESEEITGGYRREAQAQADVDPLTTCDVCGLAHSLDFIIYAYKVLSNTTAREQYDKSFWDDRWDFVDKQYWRQFPDLYEVLGFHSLHDVGFAEILTAYRLVRPRYSKHPAHCYNK